MKRSTITVSYLTKILFTISLFLLLTSCGPKQNIVYFQEVESLGSSTSISKYEPIIKPDDMLTITVSALDQDLARPFNLPTYSFGSVGSAVSAKERQETYLVDSNGFIDFPVLGKLKLAGLTRIQATSLIKDMLDPEYLKAPIVNIRTVNFKVTVLGEVKSPGAFTIQNERITILEALGLAGDLTIQGDRENVLVIREVNGKKTFTKVNLTNEEIFNSPVYYLTQNDVVYIRPNNPKINSASVSAKTSENLRIVSTLVTVAALVISITR